MKTHDLLPSDIITYHRKTTLQEIKFGEGSTHYCDFPIHLVTKKNGELKSFFYCKNLPGVHNDGLRYSR